MLELAPSTFLGGRAEPSRTSKLYYKVSLKHALLAGCGAEEEKW
jgi:hypothetical protein